MICKSNFFFVLIQPALLLVLFPVGAHGKTKLVEIPTGSQSIVIEVDSETNISHDESSTIVNGDIVIRLNESDILISPSSSNNLTNHSATANFFTLNWGKFATVGYTAVLKDIEGAGCIVIIEEFGDHPPEVQPREEGIAILNCAALRFVSFESGGYRSVASIFRDWMKAKNHYRHIYDKPMGREIAGALAARPVQHGAISAKVWERLQPIIPSAVLVWRQFGSPADGIENFSFELQEKLDKSGKYFFLPWGSLLTPISPERSSNGLGVLGFSAMPEKIINNWSWTDKKGQLRHPMVSHGGKPATPHTNGLLCAKAQTGRVLHWINKVQNHPNCYRMDGINLDSTAYYLKWFHYPGNCEHPDHPATYKDWVYGLRSMFKAAYDKGLMISHEGCAFFLDKYTLHTYGKSMVSLGIYTGWYLKKEGVDKDPNKVIKTITNHVPVNEMIYHDQLALRIHDAEALNIRYATSEQYEQIRQIKHVFNALYGLTPNLQLGGSDADLLITEDLKWMKKEMPRALETYKLLYGQQLVDHRFLSKDRKVQQTTYRNGLRIIANFSDRSVKIDKIKISAIDYVVIR